MSKEIQQPDIPRPDSKDPFTWASHPRVRVEWVREVGPQLEIEVGKFILGKVLRRIISDDANCFNWTFGGVSFNPDYALEAKRLLTERMDWEATTPEAPPIIKRWLRKASMAIFAFNWDQKDQFDQAEFRWNKFKKKVERLIEKSPKLQEAERYYFEQSSRLSPYWIDFLEGE
jgi:hypothetical protein